MLPLSATDCPRADPSAHLTRRQWLQAAVGGVAGGAASWASSSLFSRPAVAAGNAFRAAPTVMTLGMGNYGLQSLPVLDAVALIDRLGFDAVYNLVGGLDRWSREVDPAFPRY